MKKKLPGLNGLRAIAASLVLFIHAYEIAGMCGDKFSSAFYNRHLYIGSDMVNLFFVISGFIITYILFIERIELDKVSLKNFYVKRILRIWPLYFGIMLIVDFLLKYTGVYSNFSAFNKAGLILLFTFSVTLMPFFPTAGLSVLPHYWSLSVEEQFYIVWPFVFKKIKPHRVLFVSILIISCMVVIRNILAYLSSHGYSHIWLLLNEVLSSSKFSSIAIGIIGAYMVISRNLILDFAFNKWAQILAWSIFVYSIFLPFYIPYIHYEVMAVIYLILILNVSSNPAALISMESRFLDKTGTISYGIYMYHWPLIPLVIFAAKKWGFWELFVNSRQIPLIIIAYGLTYLIAFLSYNYFESYFLRLKPKRKKVIAVSQSLSQ
jgi:peptidoglycan/LPS O-acetylase OafA/YrhL